MRATTASLEGYLESPATGSLVIAGWVFSRERPIRGVELAIDGGAPVALAYGVQRTDVERRHPTESSRDSGFGALVPLAGSTQRVVRIELFVTFDDGRRMPWTKRDVRLYEAGPVARLTRVASIVMNAARTAISTRRLPPEPGTWARTLLRHWQGVPYHQPVRREKPEPFDRALFERSYRAFLTTLAYRAIQQDDHARMGHVDVVVLAGRAPLDWLTDAMGSETMATFWVVWSGERPSDAQRAFLDRCAAERLRHVELGELCDRDGRWQPPGIAECVVLIDDRTVPAGAGLARAVRGLRESGADWVYTDDDRVDANGRRFDAYFKGGFSPELLVVDDFATRLAAVRRDAITRAGGISRAAGDAALVDLLFRVWRNGGHVHHVADVCCHRLEPTSRVPSERHRDVACAAVAAATGRLATIERCSDSQPRVHWSHDALNARVTIVIPTRDRVELLRACVDSLNRTVDPVRAELLIVDDRSARGVASIGLFLAAGSAIGTLSARLARSTPLLQLVARAAFVVALAGLAGRTIIRNAVWASPIGLWAEAVELAPDHWLPHLLLGEALHAAGRREEAMLAYSRVIELRPEETLAYQKLALGYAESGRYDEARDTFERLRQLDPKSPIPSSGFGAIALLMHQPEQARAHFLEALRLDAANVRARQALAAMAEQPPADYREALRLCQEIQQLAPRTPGNDDCIRRNQERLAAQPANGR